MAERRMFAQTIIDSDAFLDMPLSAQALYFHLGMRADDEGFINNPKKIARVVGASVDDLEELIEKRFLIQFESGIVVVKHWKINNMIRSDRLVATVYKEEKSHLQEKDNRAYTLRTDDNQMTTKCQPSVNQVSAECPHSIVEYSIGKYSIDKCSSNTVNVISKKNLPPLPPIITLPCKADEEYIVTQGEYEEMTDTYPTLDVMGELRAMKGWLIGNKNKLKLKDDIPKFMYGWLNDERKKKNASLTEEKPKQNKLGVFGDYKQSSTDEEWDELGKLLGG